MIKRIKNFLSKEEWNFDAFISSIIIFIGIIIDTNWEENILSIVLTISGGIFASCILYVILAVTFTISDEHVPLKGFVSGFIICFILFGTYNIYNIGQEQEEIVVTMDADYNTKIYDFHIEDYVSGSNNKFDFEKFTNDIEDSIYETQEQYEEYYDARIGEKYYKKIEN